MVRWLECISIVANSISLKKYAAIKIIFIRVDSLTRKTLGLEIILGRGLMLFCQSLSFLGARTERTHQRSHAAVFPERDKFLSSSNKLR